MMFIQKGMLMTKTRNLFKGYSLEFKLHNEVVCYEKIGCAGFIRNPLNNKFVYVVTTPLNGKVMYREAESFNDYKGGINQWCYPADFKKNVLKLLEIQN